MAANKAEEVVAFSRRFSAALRTATRAARDAERFAVREAHRLETRLRPGDPIVVYDPHYAICGTTMVDPERSTKVLDYLLRTGWLVPKMVVSPPPLRFSELLRVHDAKYLESLDDPGVFFRIFGEEATREKAIEVLDAQRWALSGTVHAARLAIDPARGHSRARSQSRPNKGSVRRNLVVNLGGGFHHASRAHGQGFCAFNDIAVAVDALREDGFRGRILVIDLDFHHGDGTRALFATDESVFTYSLHGQSWDDRPAITSLDVVLGAATGDLTYQNLLKKTLPEFFSRAAPELVFYVAGVDVAADDRLGGFRLSADAVSERDRFVFELTGGLPMVMLLAGGYGPNAWRYTARSLQFALSGTDTPIPSNDEIALSRFRRIRDRIAARRLSSLRSSKSPDPDDEITVTEADLYGDLLRKSSDPRFLGFYTPLGLELAFEKYGLAAHLRQRGYPDFEIVVDEIGTVGRGLRVFADRARKDILIELALSEFHGVANAKLLSIEWLLLQDPRRPAGEAAQEQSAEGGLLPGQTHPGLGALKTVVGMLVMVCERLGFDGITLIPSQYHVASRSRRLFQFIDPAGEAAFIALSSATAGLGLRQASRLIADGEVVDRATGLPFAYRPERMVLAVSSAFKTRLGSPDFALEVEAVAGKLDLQLSAAARSRSSLSR